MVAYKTAQLQNSAILVIIVIVMLVFLPPKKLRKHKQTWVHTGNRGISCINKLLQTCMHKHMDGHARFISVVSTSPHDEEHLTTEMKTNLSLDQTTHRISLSTNQLNPRAPRTVFYCDLHAPLFEYICIYCSPIAYTEPSGP